MITSKELHRMELPNGYSLVCRLDGRVAKNLDEEVPCILIGIVDKDGLYVQDIADFTPENLFDKTDVPAVVCRLWEDMYSEEYTKQLSIPVYQEPDIEIEAEE